jgi:uridine kinase
MKKPLVIGIAGGTGSGKTTVTKRIIEPFDTSRVAILRHDHYYKDLASFGGKAPGDINFDHPDALDTPLLVAHLKQLREGHSIEEPQYDFTSYQRRPTTTRIASCSVIIVEGILLFAEAELRKLMDIKIFVDTDADERLLRRLHRDLVQRGRTIESIMHQYVTTVKPMHLEFVEPSKRWADVIIPQGGENAVAIDMVVAKIQDMLRR